MTELVDLCGGHIVSDFQVMDKSDSHLTIRVPLYVSYVYATAPTGWGSLEHRTEMEVSFYYRYSVESHLLNSSLFLFCFVFF